MKQLLIILFIMSTICTAIAQTTYLLRGVVIVKGAENKKVNNVSVKVIGGNTSTTDSYGSFTLECKDKKAGDKIMLQIIAIDYVVLSLNGYIKPDKKNIIEVTLSTDSYTAIKIEIQKESELKNDYEIGLNKLKNQIDAQTRLIKTLSTKTNVTNAEREANNESRKKIDKELQGLREKLDSIGKSAEVNGFIPLLHQIEESRKQIVEILKINFDAIEKGLEDLIERDDKTKFKATAISDDAFNRWNIINKTNITPVSIQKDKIVINLDIDKTYQDNPLLIKLIWSGQNKELVGGTGDGVSFEPTKKLTWEFSKEGLKKEDILTGNKLNIFVYSKYNMPQKKNMALEITAIGVGMASVVYGLILNNKSSKDYDIYKSIRDENNTVYEPINDRRDGLFSQANASHVQSQYFEYIGGAIAAAGIVFLVKKIGWNSDVKDAREKSLLDFIPDKKRVIIEPIKGPSGTIGLGLGMQF
jgi:hypothetical protein